MKVTEKSSDIDIRREQESTHLTSLNGVLCTSWASLVAQLVKKPPVMWKTWVQSLGWEDALENERILTPVFWPGECHGLYSPRGRKEPDTTERLSLVLLN